LKIQNIPYIDIYGKLMSVSKQDGYLNEIYMEIYTEEHGDSQLHPKNCYRTLSIAPYKNTF